MYEHGWYCGCLNLCCPSKHLSPRFVIFIEIFALLFYCLWTTVQIPHIKCTWGTFTKCFSLQHVGNTKVHRQRKLTAAGQCLNYVALCSKLTFHALIMDVYGGGRIIAPALLNSVSFTPRLLYPGERALDVLRMEDLWDLVPSLLVGKIKFLLLLGIDPVFLRCPACNLFHYIDCSISVSLWNTEAETMCVIGGNCRYIKQEWTWWV